MTRHEMVTPQPGWRQCDARTAIGHCGGGGGVCGGSWASWRSASRTRRRSLLTVARPGNCGGIAGRCG